MIKSKMPQGGKRPLQKRLGNREYSKVRHSNRHQSQTLQNDKRISASKGSKTGKRLKTALWGLLGGIAALSITLLNVTLNFNFNDTTINNNSVHNHVIDEFRTMYTVDENGNRQYTVHPSRFGSPRSVVVEVLPGGSTTVVFEGN